MQVLTAPIKLPLDKIYAPSVDIEVKDTLMGGVLKRVVGASSVDLGRFLKEDPLKPGKWTVLHPDDTDQVVPVLGDAASEKEARDTKTRKLRTAKLVASAIEAEAKMKAEQKKRADQEKEAADAVKKALGSLTEKEPAGSVGIDIKDEKATPKSESKPEVKAEPSASKDGGGDLKTPLLPKKEASEKDPLIDIKLDVKPTKEEQAAHDKEREMHEIKSVVGGGGGGECGDEKEPLLAAASGFGLSGAGGSKVDMAKERAAFAALDKPPATFDALKETGDEPSGAAGDDEKPEYMKGRLEVDTDLESFMYIQPFLTVDLYTGIVGSLIDKYRKVGKYKGFVRLKDPYADQEPLSPTASPPGSPPPEPNTTSGTIAQLPDQKTPDPTASAGAASRAGGAAGLVTPNAHTPGQPLAAVPEDDPDEPAFGQQIKKKTGLKNFLKKGLERGMSKVMNKKDNKPKTEHDKKEEQLMAELLSPKEYYMRIYILRGRGLIPRSDGDVDPYLILTVGKHKVNTRDRKLKKTLDPDFYEAIELPVTIPGDAKVTIDVMDASSTGLSMADDLIGRTEIDIEDRWFSKEWRALRTYRRFVLGVEM